MLPAHVDAQIRRTSRCWQWLGSTNQGGYGFTQINYVQRVAHRVVYEDAVGPIPSGLTLDHLCRNTDCVNPAHMEPVSMRENILRGHGAAAECARRTHCVVCQSPLIQGPTQRYCLSCKRRSGREYMRRKRARA